MPEGDNCAEAVSALMVLDFPKKRLPLPYQK